jgi:hypothetical protein
MTTRKIIQIVMDPTLESNTLLFALCDDGTVWRLAQMPNAYEFKNDVPYIIQRWHQERAIPQGDEDAPLPKNVVRTPPP